jgi:hypothetical protein
MRIGHLLAVAIVCSASVPALGQMAELYNGGFEITGTPGNSGARGWNKFNFARLRNIDDGLGPVLVHSGTNSIELASGTGPTNNFAGFTTDVFDPDTLLFFNPAVSFPGGDVTVTGWYAIPTDQPLTGANAGIKLEFRRENSSVFAAFENLSITGTTNGEWLQFTLTVTNDQIQPILDQFPPGPVMVSVLPLRFGASTSTGTIFWDDIELTQGTTPPACPCDWNTDHVLNSQDFFDFISCFFTSGCDSDFNGDNILNSQDFFDFLSCFFSPPASCP